MREIIEAEFRKINNGDLCKTTTGETFVAGTKAFFNYDLDVPELEIYSRDGIHYPMHRVASNRPDFANVDS